MITFYDKQLKRQTTPMKIEFLLTKEKKEFSPKKKKEKKEFLLTKKERKKNSFRLGSDVTMKSISIRHGKPIINMLLTYLPLKENNDIKKG